MPSLVPVSCGICGSTENSRLHRIRGFQIVQCKHCGCIYTNPRYIWNYEDANVTLQEKLSLYREHYWPKRKASAARFWDRAETYRQTGYLVDVGCGFGFFLNEARQRSWSVMGVEVARDEANWGQRQFRLEIVSTLESEQLREQQFDIITLWDVLEHISDLQVFLRRCADLLRPGGALLIRIPDGRGLLLNDPWWLRPYLVLYRQLIYPANPVEHIHHFIPDVLQHLLENNNFRVVAIVEEKDWSTRVIVGRNQLVSSVRSVLHRMAYYLKLPYEIVVLAEKMQSQEA